MSNLNRMETAIAKIILDVSRINAKYPGFSEVADQAFEIVWCIDKLPKEIVTDHISRLLSEQQPAQRKHLVRVVADFIKSVEIGLEDGFLKPSTPEVSHESA
jgi:hypothetical protein